MNNQEKTNYLEIIKTKCDCCGKMVDSFYPISDYWWGKYLIEKEENICLSCISRRSGFSDEYQQMSGVSVKQGLELYGD